MTRISKFTHLLCAAASLVSAWVMAPQDAASAGPSCAQVYVARAGDTWAGLAEKLGATEDALRGLNRGRADTIRAGQELCIPGVPRQHAALEVTYQYAPNAEHEEGEMLSREGYIGKRLVYPLDLVDPVSLTTDITADVIGQMGVTPTLALARDTDANDYILVAINRPDILNALRLTDTVSITSQCGFDTYATLQEALGDASTQDVSLTAWWETATGENANEILRYPFRITRVDLVDEELFQQCYLRPEMTVGVVVFPALHAAGQSSLLVRLNNDTVGPPDRSRSLRCAQWRNRRGFWYVLLRLWNRC